MKLLLKMNDLYYTLGTETYDTTNMIYNGVNCTTTSEIQTLLQSSTLTLTQLNTSVTIGSETFKPIDKIDNFSIISDMTGTVKYNGRKSNSELVVTTLSFEPNKDIIKTINSLTGSVTKNTGDIKLVFSLNSVPATWFTFSNSECVQLTTEFNPGSYIDTHDSVKIEALKTEIASLGLTSDALDTIDFTTFYAEKIRFAIVILNDCQVSNLGIICEEQPHPIGVSDSEVSIGVYNRLVQVIPNFNATKVNVNILTRQIYDPTYISKTALDVPVLSHTITGNDITLTWDTIINAGSYEIYMDGILINTVTSTTYTQSGCDWSKTHRFVIRALPINTTTYRASSYSEPIVVEGGTYIIEGDGTYVGILINGEMLTLE